MAARSITTAYDAAAALAAIKAWADEAGARATSGPLQNGTRVRVELPAGNFGLNVYPSKGGGCKVVFDRPDDAAADAIAAALQSRPSDVKAPKSAGTSIAPAITDAECWIGSDESGKGDYFGPLVVAAVALTRHEWPALAEIGVMDSKSLTDAKAASLSSQIRAAFPHEVITIMPPRYNALFLKMRSVNRMLAWAHARAIEQVAERAPAATAAVADQFGDESLIERALFERGRTLRLVQMPRAEADPAVAAASIIARAEFLSRLALLSRDAGVTLPKGASAQVDAVGRALVARDGVEVLERFAKRHFRTTEKVLRGGR